MGSRLFQFLWDRLAHSQDVVIGAWEVADFEEQEFARLLKLGVLRECGWAEEVPHPGQPGRGTLLQVRRTARGFCGVAQEGDYSDPVPLADEFVLQYKLDCAQLAERIREQSRLAGVLETVEDRLICLGKAEIVGAESFQVFLLVGSSQPTVILEACRRLADAAEGRRFLLLPHVPKSSPETLQLIADWGFVLVALAEYIDSVSWQISFQDIAADKGLIPDNSALPAGCHSIAYTRDGANALHREEHDRLIRRPAKYSIFVDGTTGSVLRSLAPPREKKHLTPLERSILVELVRRREPVRLGECQFSEDRTATTVRKALESMRRKIDRRLTKKTWTCITLRHEVLRTDLRYHFDPPKSVHYCVLAPPQPTEQ